MAGTPSAPLKGELSAEQADCGVDGTSENPSDLAMLGHLPLKGEAFTAPSKELCHSERSIEDAKSKNPHLLPPKAAHGKAMQGKRILRLVSLAQNDTDGAKDN